MQVVCPCSCAISCTRWMKGCLWMRSSALLWYQHISQRATSPTSTSGASSAHPSRTPSLGAFQPVVGLMKPTSLPAVDGVVPTSAAILANCLVGKDPSDIPSVSMPSAASPIWLTLLGMVGFFLRGSSDLPSVSLSALPSGMKQQAVSIQWQAFQSCPHFLFVVNGWLIWGIAVSVRMAGMCSQFACILEREASTFEEAMREQVGTIFHSANGLDNVESFWNVYQYWYYHPWWRKRNFRPHLPLNYADFQEG